MEGMKEFLDKRKEEGLLRTLKDYSSKKDGYISFDGKEYVDFSSNDYLGLVNHPKMIAAAREAGARYGTGAGASRLLTGSSEMLRLLEDKVAAFKGTESSLVFNSGYQANIGIISALCKSGDVIFSDKLNHASIIDGIKLSGARFFRFKHNDMNHLEMLLRRERKKFKNSLIITESVFSMDGDKAFLKEIVELKKRYDSMVMIDEAHATGVFGERGSGIAEEYGLISDVDFIMGTFSKALGSFGAYFGCSKIIKEYLINTCRSFIYSTALPPVVIAANIESLNIVENEPKRRIKLLENAEFLRGILRDKGFKVIGESQIVPVIIGDTDKTVLFSKALQDKGFWVMPIRPPTVPSGEARLRFSLSYNHTEEMLGSLVQTMSSLEF